jgi:hypothetical protein
MPGGLIQLASYGSEDIYFTGNPQMSFFKSVYTRYTNFSTEVINMTFDKIPDFKSSTLLANCKIQRAGDMIRNLFLRLKLPSVQNYNYEYNPEDNKFNAISLIIDDGIDIQEIPIDRSHLRAKSDIQKIDLGAAFTNDETTGVKLDGYFAIEDSVENNALDLVANVAIDSSTAYYLQGIITIPIEDDIEDITKYPVELVEQELDGDGNPVLDGDGNPVFVVNTYSLFAAYNKLYETNSILAGYSLSLQKIVKTNYTIYELPVVFTARIFDIQSKPANPQTYVDGLTTYRYYYIEWGESSYPYGALLNYINMNDTETISVYQWQNNANYQQYKFIVPEYNVVYTHYTTINPYNNQIMYYPNKNFRGSIKNFRWTLNIAKSVYLFINGIKIVEMSFDYIIAQLKSQASGEKKRMLDRLIGNIDALINPEDSEVGYPTPEYELNIPIPFWFAKDIGWALPLIAMPKSVVEFRVDFSSISDENNTTNNFAGNSFYKGIAFEAPDIKDISLDIDYIFLDKDEREKFALNTHEYLIEQVQSNIFTNLTGTSILRVNFLHPTSELILYVKNERETAKYPMNKLFGYKTGVEYIKNIRILFNGNDRLQVHPVKYFDTVQPYLHHSGDTYPEYLYYSFSLNPEETQPSGSCNFSRINSVLLEIELDPLYLNKSFKYNSATGNPSVILEKQADNSLRTKYEYTTAETKIYVYARNYNVLSILGGLAGVKFAS